MVAEDFDATAAWAEWRKHNTLFAQSVWHYFDNQERLLLQFLDSSGAQRSPERLKLLPSAENRAGCSSGLRHSWSEVVTSTPTPAVSSQRSFTESAPPVAPPDDAGHRAPRRVGDSISSSSLPHVVPDVVIPKEAIASSSAGERSPSDSEGSPSRLQRKRSNKAGSQSLALRPKEVSFAEPRPPQELEKDPLPPEVSALQKFSQESLSPTLPWASERSEPLESPAQLKPFAASGWKRAAKKIQAAAAMKIASPTQTVKSETGSSVAASPGRSTADSAFNSQAGKIRKRLAFLRASTADVDRQFFFPQIGHFWRDVFNRLHSSVSWILHLEEPERTSCLAKLIAHKTFEAIVMLAVLANTVFIAVQTNFEMETLGQTYASGPFVETVFLIFFTVEIVLRLLVHRLYFFCNEDMSWNLMDLVLMLLAYMDIFFEYYNVQVGRVGMLRLLRVTRLFRIMRVLRFLKEVRVMLVAIVGSFISLFWALGMLAVIIFIFAIYFMQQMTAYLQITPQEDELWSLQWDYFHNTGSAMYVLLMASTGGKDWEEVYQLVAPLGADCAIAFTFYLLFFTLGVMNIITGVFVENASVLFKPDDQEALAEYMKQVQDDIQEVTAIMHTIDTDGSGSLSVDEFLTAMQNDRVEHALRQIGVDIRMPEHYFKTLAAITEQEEIAIDEFVAHIVQMKGAASRTDVQTLTLEVAMLQREMEKLQLAIGQTMASMQRLQQEQTEFRVEIREGQGELCRRQTTLRDGLYEEFMRHQRELAKRASGSAPATHSQSFGMFNFRDASKRSLALVGGLSPSTSISNSAMLRREPPAARVAAGSSG